MSIETTRLVRDGVKGGMEVKVNMVLNVHRNRTAY